MIPSDSVFNETIAFRHSLHSLHLIRQNGLLLPLPPSLAAYWDRAIHHGEKLLRSSAIDLQHTHAQTDEPLKQSRHHYCSAPSHSPSLFFLAVTITQDSTALRKPHYSLWATRETKQPFHFRFYSFVMPIYTAGTRWQIFYIAAVICGWLQLLTLLL